MSRTCDLRFSGSCRQEIQEVGTVVGLVDSVVCLKPTDMFHPSSLKRRITDKPLTFRADGRYLERVTGIEPAYPTWKDGALAIELHPQGTRMLSQKE